MYLHQCNSYILLNIEIPDPTMPPSALEDVFFYFPPHLSMLGLFSPTLYVSTHLALFTCSFHPSKTLNPL